MILLCSFLLLLSGLVYTDDDFRQKRQSSFRSNIPGSSRANSFSNLGPLDGTSSFSNIPSSAFSSNRNPSSDGSSFSNLSPLPTLSFAGSNPPFPASSSSSSNQSPGFDSRPFRGQGSQGSQGGSSASSSAQSDIIESIHELGLDLSIGKLKEGYTGNFVQSPLSIAALLNLILIGTEGETYNQLKNSLRSTQLNDEDIKRAYRDILLATNSARNGIEVTMSSRLFLQIGFPVLGSYTADAERAFNSSVISVDFQRSPQQAVNEVNEWVERSTHGKIKDLINDRFSPDTKFVAANVIYFRGNWELPFDEGLTSPGEFDTGSKVITVPMMSNIITVPILNDKQNGFDMIALPYEGGFYSMYIVTPHGKPNQRNLERLELKMTSDNLLTYIRLMDKRRISVQIPRMSVRYKFLLKNDLQQLGVRDIFDQRRASLGRLTRDNGVFLSNVVHEAVLEINEVGTVAAAASAGSFDRIGTEAFRLNKPSLIYIIDNRNGITLFSARVMEPEPL